MTDKKTFDATIWKRWMMRYSIVMVLGIMVTVLIIPYVRESLEAWNMSILLLGGLGIFGGFFGVVVSLFFHLWHGKPSE
ncbi:MAG: hypothetical protein Q9M10_05955 [Mariprofundaceae bacterium]|nr:hypothetical protein [Mariprofundaceae bacterium]